MTLRFFLLFSAVHATICVAATILGVAAVVRLSEANFNAAVSYGLIFAALSFAVLCLLHFLANVRKRLWFWVLSFACALFAGGGMSLYSSYLAAVETMRWFRKVTAWGAFLILMGLNLAFVFSCLGTNTYLYLFPQSHSAIIGVANGYLHLGYTDNTMPDNLLGTNWEPYPAYETEPYSTDIISHAYLHVFYEPGDGFRIFHFSTTSDDGYYAFDMPALVVVVLLALMVYRFVILARRRFIVPIDRVSESS